MSEVEKNDARQIIIINQPKSNGIGTTGFVLALISLLFGWVPGWGWIIWGGGLICSLIGMFREPKGLATAGVVISLFGLAIIIIVVYLMIHSILR